MYVLAFDSALVPVVSQQVTLTSLNLGLASTRASLLEQRAGTTFTSKILGGTATECDLLLLLYKTA
jgi:hypothetical protein